MSNLRDNPNIVNEVADLRRDLDELALNSGGGGGAVQSVDGKTGAVIIHKDLTQAQYNALSQAEKMNGVEYFITDTSGSLDYADGEWHKIGMNKLSAAAVTQIPVNIPSELQTGLWEFKAEATIRVTHNMSGTFFYQLTAVTADSAKSAVNNIQWYYNNAGAAPMATWGSQDGWNGVEVNADASGSSFVMKCYWSKSNVNDYWNFTGEAGGWHNGANNAELCKSGGRISSNQPITVIKLWSNSQPANGVATFQAGTRVTVYARKIN